MTYEDKAAQACLRVIGLPHPDFGKAITAIVVANAHSAK